MPYRPLTGAKCTCKRGIERDNCASCEGTGKSIDFAKIRAERAQKPEPVVPARSALYDIEIISIRRLEGAGNLKAFVDIRVGGELVIIQCAVMTGLRGLFACLPRQLARDGRWRDIVVVGTQELRDHYCDAILKAYEAEVTTANAN